VHQIFVLFTILINNHVMLLQWAEHVTMKLSTFWTVQWMREKFKVKFSNHFKSHIGWMRLSFVLLQYNIFRQ